MWYVVASLIVNSVSSCVGMGEHCYVLTIGTQNNWPMYTLLLDIYYYTLSLSGHTLAQHQEDNVDNKEHAGICI